MKDIYYCEDCEKFVNEQHCCQRGQECVYRIPAAAVEAIKADKHLPPPEMPDTVWVVDDNQQSITGMPYGGWYGGKQTTEKPQAEYRRVKLCDCDGVQIVGGNYCWKCGGRVAE